MGDGRWAMTRGSDAARVQDEVETEARQAPRVLRRASPPSRARRCMARRRSRRRSKVDEPLVEGILLLIRVERALDQLGVKPVQLGDGGGRHLEVVAILDLDAQQVA